MKLHFITVGEPRLDYAKRGWDEYYQRLGRYHKIKTTRLKDKADPTQEVVRAAGNAYLMLLDPRGRHLTSEELSARLDQVALSGHGEIALVIGGPDGHSDELREKAHFLWSMSKLTFPHDLAMVVMLEALYRASTISKGEPYHR